MAHCDGFILTCVLVAWGGGAGAAQDLQQPERQKTVLTFYSARMGVPAVVSLDRAIEQTLAQGLKGGSTTTSSISIWPVFLTLLTRARRETSSGPSTSTTASM